MTAKHKRVLAQAKRLVANYKRAVRKLERFKASHCRAGDEIGDTGAYYAGSKAIPGVYVKRPGYVVVKRWDNEDWQSDYPLVSAIREDVEK